MEGMRGNGRDGREKQRGRHQNERHEGLKE